MNMVLFDILRISAEDVKNCCETMTPTWLQLPCRDNVFVKLFTCFIYFYCITHTIDTTRPVLYSTVLPCWIMHVNFNGTRLYFVAFSVLFVCCDVLLKLVL